MTLKALFSNHFTLSALGVRREYTPHGMPVHRRTPFTPIYCDTQEAKGKTDFTCHCTGKFANKEAERYKEKIFSHAGQQEMETGSEVTNWTIKLAPPSTDSFDSRPESGGKTQAWKRSHLSQTACSCVFKRWENTGSKLRNHVQIWGQWPRNWKGQHYTLSLNSTSANKMQH